MILLIFFEIMLLISQGMTVLHWSCDRGYIEIVKLLLEFKANINEQVSTTKCEYIE